MPPELGRAIRIEGERTIPIEYIHDAEELRVPLTRWIEVQLGVPNVRIHGFDQPLDAGGSNETRFIQVEAENREAFERHYVLRIAPTRNQLFLAPHLATQYRVLENLQGSDIPVPGLLGADFEGTVLGIPFFVMDRVAGQVPAASYNQSGFLARATVTQRRSIWRRAISTLVAISRFPTTDLPALTEGPDDLAGLDQHLRYWQRALTWANQGKSDPVGEALGQALWESRPPAKAGLSWGDAKVGNMIFRDDVVAAVIDWEQVSLAGGLADLGWWLIFDLYHSSVRGCPRLGGLPDRNETLQWWEELGGQQPTSIEWYELFAAFRLLVIFRRQAELRVERRDHEGGVELRKSNAALDILSVLKDRR